MTNSSKCGDAARESAGRPCRYLPVSTPRPSGDHGSTPSPSAAHAGSTSRSMPRSSSEYSTWAQTRLAAWSALGRSIDELKATMVENKKLAGDNDALNKENKVLARSLKQTKSELDLLTGVKTKVELPPDLKGKVVAVDPKYEFVVLDIGLDDGVLARGEMLVNRSGKLVAKVRILTAESHRSVANVLADWKQGEIMEGDVVLVGL